MSSCFYGIYLRGYKRLLLVNERDGDVPDVLVDIKPDNTISIHDYSQEIATEIFGNLPARYSYKRMIFTADDEGNVVTSTFLHHCKSGRVKDYVATKGCDRMALTMARFVMWCECIRNDRDEAVEVAVETSEYDSDDDDDDEDKEICVICHEEYSTVDCRHSYHENAVTVRFVGGMPSFCGILISFFTPSVD